MKPSELFIEIIQEIESRKGDGVFMVGIDGIDAAGKTTFAMTLSNELRKRNHKVIEGSMDGFHNPREKRYRFGRDSPEGYYRDSFDVEALKSRLLEPLMNGLTYRTVVFDYRADTSVYETLRKTPKDAILVFEGVFSFREALRGFWDFMIYLDISPEESLRRGVERDPGEETEIERKYKVRYLPSQELYKAESKPLEVAHIIVDYNDPENPRIL